ncbi:glucosyltransferase [Sporothrix epigloea]|uniref:Dol-P-Glc:Glc(2)Man(9)GlcNAc(2)-PP-Dol alpha-1,2-glucosyltransferase n=1 Tax=Sporothrix epigloea TaxID=1892477 RepID=A0ABP0DEY4_9PEZI
MSADKEPGPWAIMLIDDPQLKVFLGSALFVLPWLVYQAYILGDSLRQRPAAADAKDESTVKLRAYEPASKKRDDKSSATEVVGSAETAAIVASPSRLGGRKLLFLGATTLLSSFAKAWLVRVLATVPEPYLDEFFHVPQAQKYCARQWYDWDDKITTPPGLYLVSVAMETMWSGVKNGCHIWALRGANTVAIVLVALTASACRAALELQKNTSKAAARPEHQGAMSFYALHTGFNVALFPILFFFSALYYTDVYSTLAVLAAYRLHLFRASVPALEPMPVWSDLLTVLVGFAALVMRQTNIFWIVVYLGGLEIVQAAKAVRQQPLHRAALVTAQKATFDSLPDMARLYLWRYSCGDVHDPPLATSWPDDWLLSLLSVAVAAVSNPIVVLQRTWPFVAVLLGFVQFVVWNGGVVLGDKSNHVATIHAAQLLYLWPLLAFFSAPLFVTHVLYYVGLAWDTVTGSINADKQASGDTLAAAPLTKAAFPDGKETHSGPTLLRWLHVVAVDKTYYPVYLFVVFNAMLAIVHWNTLIHPFTLADNRHYMFYVFRHTIRRDTWIRYALVPVYALTGWACWRVLWLGLGSGGNAMDGDPVAASEYMSSPFSFGGMLLPAEDEDRERQDVGAGGASAMAQGEKERHLRQRRGNRTNNRKTDGGKASKVAQAEEATEEGDVTAQNTGSCGIFLGFLDEDEDGSATASRAGPTTTTALLWLLATSLSLVTAPLVEPRYFILPWVFWRLLMPAAKADASRPEERKANSLAASLFGKVDLRLFLETAWFVAINVTTMYIFLYRPFVWRATDGSPMDGGRLQRFMW